MSRIVLVRHGQASFWAAEYDQLSPLGIEQSRLLGEHWGAAGLRFARVYTGPRTRQRATCAVATEAHVRTGGSPGPEFVEIPEFDEHHGQTVCAATLPPAPAFDESDEEARRAYLRRFSTTLHDWASGQLAIADVESYSTFRNRVQIAMERVRADVPRGEVAVVFTSGGVIAAAVGGMLRAADLETFALSARIANASTTEFVTTPTRMSLASFNLVSHVPDHLVTLI